MFGQIGHYFDIFSASFLLVEIIDREYLASSDN